MIEKLLNVLSNYNIGFVKKIEMISSHRNIVSKIVTDIGEYYLKVYPSTVNMATLSVVTGIQNYLTRNMKGIETIVENSSKDYVSTIDNIDGFSSCILTLGITGKAIDNIIDETKVFDLGVLIANTHNTLDKLYESKKANYETEVEFALSKRNKMKVVEEYIEVPFNVLLSYLKTESLKTRIIQLKERLKDKVLHNLDELDFGICHGDIHIDNIIYDLHERLTLFDFELTRCNFRIYDIATLLWSLFPRENYSKEVIDETNDLIESLLCGYTSIRELNQRDQNILSDFIVIRHIWRLAFRIENKESIDDDIVSFQMKRVEKWIELFPS